MQPNRTLIPPTLACLLLICLSTSATATQRVQGWCEQGKQPVLVPLNSPSTTLVQRSFPKCTVTVYLTGTGGTLATLYSDNAGTPLANPFTADQFGHWFYYVADGYNDVQLSGAGFSAPYTFGAVNVIDAYFLQNGTGAVARTKQSKESDIVSAKDFGACGNGVCNDTNALQLGINYVSSGHCLYLPAGTYNHTGLTVAPGANLCIKGAGREQSVLMNVGSGAAFYAVGVHTPFLGIELHLSDFTNDSTGIDTYGFDLGCIIRSELINVGSRSHGLDGFIVGYSWIISLVNINSQFNGRDGLRLDGTLHFPTDPGNQNAITVLGGNLEQNTEVGYRLFSGGRGNSIYGATIEGNGSEGIALSTPDGFTASGIYFESNGVNNVKPTISESQYSGADGFGVSINGNFFQGTNLGSPFATYGIDIESGYEGVIQGNSFFNNKAGSIKIGGTAYGTFVGQNYWGDPAGTVADTGNATIQVFTGPSGAILKSTGPVSVIGTPVSIYSTGNATMNASGGRFLFPQAPGFSAGMIVSDGTFIYSATAGGNFFIGDDDYVKINGKLTVDPQGRILSTGPLVLITSCGTGPAFSVAPSEIRGTITEGSGASGCVLSWTNTPANAPSCVLSSRDGLAFTYTVDATAITITNVGALSSKKIDFVCVY